MYGTLLPSSPYVFMNRWSVTELIINFAQLRYTTRIHRRLRSSGLLIIEMDGSSAHFTFPREFSASLEEKVNCNKIYL
jgi:hypothetical protein